ncbi:MAG: GNAT family N-acetyltransferase [Bacteroidales bacterium]|jgi:GNAT superfamily N-acetyltransferase|nr:GNAT family N-acetyltransferase [Bacteroidales bacterium]
MSIEIREVTGKQGFKEFVKFPFKLYKTNKYWVPPIIKDEVQVLQKEHNPAFNYCDAKFWVAYKDGKPAGRIGAIINRKDIEKTGEKYGRFSRFEAIDDHNVIKELIEEAEKWIRTEGMEGVRGPLGFSNLDHQGMLVEGFDHLPSIASEYQMPYYKEHLEKLGYGKHIDWVEFRLTIEDVPAKAKKLTEIIKKRYKLKVVNFTKNKELLPYGKEVFKLLNEAFKDLFSVVELDEQMIDYYFKRYFGLLNPRFVKVVQDENDQMVGFIVGLPSLSRAMQKANGKLFPFGFRHILKALKNPTEVDLLLTGIDPEMQGKGVSALLIQELQQVMIDHNVRHVETTGIFETNQKAIQHWKNYNHIQHKRKRCFTKNFN